MARDRVVLITGVSRYLGGRLAARLQRDPSISRVIGVDVVPPRADLGRTEFVRADIRNPVIAKVISAAGVDTVVHMNVIATPFRAGGRRAMKEINVIGSMQLLAACQRSPSLRQLIVKSTTAVYGASSHDPAFFTEEEEPRSLPRTGYAKDSVEVEGYVRGLARRRPDVAVTVLRFANFIGPCIETPLTSYFSLAVVPTFFGFDPRLQFLHEDDGVELLARATRETHPGAFNVAGSGVLLLSQAIRRAGRVPCPVPTPIGAVAAQALRRAGAVDFSPEQVAFLRYGRVVDTERVEAAFGWRAAYSTRQAFDDFVRGRRLAGPLSAPRIASVDEAVRSRLGLQEVRAGA